MGETCYHHPVYKTGGPSWTSTTWSTWSLKDPSGSRLSRDGTCAEAEGVMNQKSSLQ